VSGEELEGTLPQHKPWVDRLPTNFERSQVKYSRKD
jgi:hypothetical protein